MEDTSSFANPMEDTPADVFLPSARCARAPQILQLSGPFGEKLYRLKTAALTTPAISA